MHLRVNLCMYVSDSSWSNKAGQAMGHVTELVCVFLNKFLPFFIRVAISKLATWNSQEIINEKKKVHNDLKKFTKIPELYHFWSYTEPIPCKLWHLRLNNVHFRHFESFSCRRETFSQTRKRLKIPFNVIMTQGSLWTRVSLSPWKRVVLLSNVPAETVDSAVSSLKNSKYFSYRYMKDRVEVRNELIQTIIKRFRNKEYFD